MVQLNITPAPDPLLTQYHTNRLNNTISHYLSYKSEEPKLRSLLLCCLNQQQLNNIHNTLIS